MALYFSLRWVIHLVGQSPAELQPRQLGERWSVSHNQSASVLRKEHIGKKNDRFFSSAFYGLSLIQSYFATECKYTCMLCRCFVFEALHLSLVAFSLLMHG